jgi:hypothetical protein
MTRGTCREARTQEASICRHIGATEDAASRHVTSVRRPGSFPGQAPRPPLATLSRHLRNASARVSDTGTWPFGPRPSGRPGGANRVGAVAASSRRGASFPRAGVPSRQPSGGWPPVGAAPAAPPEAARRAARARARGSEPGCARPGRRRAGRAPPARRRDASAPRSATATPRRRGSPRPASRSSARAALRGRSSARCGRRPRRGRGRRSA